MKDADLERPLPGAWSTRRGRDEYLAENGFTLAAYDEPRTKASFLGLDFSVPNTPAHRRAIKLHDLHHVATGYGTDVRGEGEISAWELRGGLRGLDLYVGGIVLSGALLGFVIAPRRTWRAWKAGAKARPLWTTRPDYEAVLDESVEALRERVGAPREGVAAGQRALHKNAPRRDASPEAVRVEPLADVSCSSASRSCSSAACRRARRSPCRCRTDPWSRTRGCPGRPSRRCTP